MSSEQERPITILHLEPPHHGGQGDSVYRTVQPCRAMGQLPNVEIIAGTFISPLIHELLPIADVVVLCDVVEADLIPILRHRHAVGLPTIYEVNDDFQALQTWNPTAYLANNSYTRSLSSRLAAYCGNVQFSTPYLAQQFEMLAPHRAVFVNNLWEMPGNHVDRRTSGVQIGWGGSIGHKDDFIALAAVMKQILERHSEVTFHIMGHDIFRDLCHTLPVGRYVYRQAGSLSEYLSFVSTLDIGVCPLDDTDFNRGRSDVKFLEYASHGVATIAANLPPYQASVRHGETGFLFQDKAELHQLLSTLIECSEMRTRIGETGRNYVQTCRMERPHATARLAFMQKCRDRMATAPQLATSSLIRPRYTGTFNKIAARRHFGKSFKTFTDSSAKICEIDDLGAMILSGLAALRDGDLPGAKDCFRRALQLSPRFYLPWLYLGNVEEDHRQAVKLLDTAIELHPLSATALLTRSSRVEAMGNIRKAQTDLERASHIAPELGAPCAQLAELAERQGNTPLAVELEALALSQNVYYALPHIRRALTMVDNGMLPDTAALELCLQHDNRYWGTRFVLGRAALNAHSPHSAREHLLVALKYAPDPSPVMAQLARAEIALGDMSAARKWLDAAKEHAHNPH